MAHGVGSLRLAAVEPPLLKANIALWLSESSTIAAVFDPQLAPVAASPTKSSIAPGIPHFVSNNCLMQKGKQAFELV